MSAQDLAILILLKERYALYELGTLTYDETEVELIKKAQDKIDRAIELLKKEGVKE